MQQLGSPARLCFNSTSCVVCILAGASLAVSWRAPSTQADSESKEDIAGGGQADTEGGGAAKKKERKKKTPAVKQPSTKIVNTFHYVDTLRQNPPCVEGHLVISIVASCSTSTSVKRERVYTDLANLVDDINRSISNDGCAPDKSVLTKRPDGTCAGCSAILAGSRDFCSSCGKKSFYSQHTGASKEHVSLWCGCGIGPNDGKKTCLCFETCMGETNVSTKELILSRTKLNVMHNSATLFHHFQPTDDATQNTLEVQRTLTLDSEQYEQQDLVVAMQYSGFLSQSLRKLSHAQREVMHSIISKSHVPR